MTNKPATERAWDVIVRQADPDYERKRHKEIEYEFSNGRQFTADRDKRPPYDGA